MPDKSGYEFFSRSEYYDSITKKSGKKSSESLAYAIRKDVSAGLIIRVGRDQYAYPQNLRTYSHLYSKEASDLADEILNEYPEAEFRIFELTQMNEFVNHQIAHNTIFVSVENDLMDFVFDTLKSSHSGRVMLKPSVDNYYRYLVEGQIVVLRLPSESPRGADKNWHSRLEKILVDVAADKLISKLIPESEYSAIVNDAFQKYYLDRNMMNRYANRKGALKKYKAFLEKYAEENR